MADPQPGMLNDAEASVDLLNFAPYRDALVRAVTSSPAPFTLGIFGEWGCGKSTLMRHIRGALDVLAPERGTKTMWFNAWKFDGDEAIWNALIRTVLLEIERLQPKDPKHDKGPPLTDKIKRATKRATGLALRIGTAIASKGAVKNEQIDQLGKLFAEDEQSWDRIDERTRLETEFKEIVSEFVGAAGRLVIFVDDLDRCSPSQAIGVLEAMRFFFDHSNCVFVIGVDRVVLESYLDAKYREIKHKSGRDYLEKLIQLPFNMSAIDPAPSLRILDDYGTTFHGFGDDFRGLVMAGTSGNPRRIKRFANIFILMTELRPVSSASEANTIAFALLLQMRFPNYFEEFAARPGTLQAFFKIMTADSRQREHEFAIDQKSKAMYEDWEFKNFIERAYPDVEAAKVDAWLRLTFDMVA